MKPSTLRTDGLTVILLVRQSVSRLWNTPCSISFLILKIFLLIVVAEKPLEVSNCLSMRPDSLWKEANKSIELSDTSQFICWSYCCELWLYWAQILVFYHLISFHFYLFVRILQKLGIHYSKKLKYCIVRAAEMQCFLVKYFRFIEASIEAAVW